MNIISYRENNIDENTMNTIFEKIEDYLPSLSSRKIPGVPPPEHQTNSWKCIHKFYTSTSNKNYQRFVENQKL